MAKMVFFTSRPAARIDVLNSLPGFTALYWVSAESSSASTVASAVALSTKVGAVTW